MGNDPVIEENSFVSVGAERLMMEAKPDFARLFTLPVYMDTVSTHDATAPTDLTRFRHTLTQHERISGEVFRPRERLKSQRDFQRVMNGGRNFNGKLMRIKYLSLIHI